MVSGFPQTDETDEKINDSPNEFVVITDDLTNLGDDDERERVHSILSNLKIPYYIVSGNHETTWSISAGMTYKKLSYLTTSRPMMFPNPTVLPFYWGLFYCGL